MVTGVCELENRDAFEIQLHSYFESEGEQK
jgi:hypothetical protein